jgi:hypothetical protein
MSWKTLVYSAPLTNTQNFGNEVSESAAGTWISPLSFVDMIGSTNFAAQTQDGAVHATINQQVLQVICLFDVEFRQPCPDIGTFGSKSHKYALQTFPRSVLSGEQRRLQIRSNGDGCEVKEDVSKGSIVQSGLSGHGSGTGVINQNSSSSRDSRGYDEYVNVSTSLLPTALSGTRSVASPMIRGLSPRRDKG